MRLGTKTKTVLKRTGAERRKFLTQRRKDAKADSRKAAALCVFATLRENSLGLSYFSGALGSAFYESISSRWGLAGSALLKPARKIFLKPFCTPDFSPGPAHNAIAVSNFTLLAHVQLKLALGVSNRMFFAGANYSSKQTSTMASGDPQVISLPGEAGVHESSSLRETISRTSTRIRERSSRQSSLLSFTVLPRWIINSAPPRKTQERQSSLRAVFTSSLSSLLHTTERWLRFIKLTSFRGASGFSGSQPDAAPGPLSIALMAKAANVVQNDRSRAWPALVLRNIVTAALKASDSAAGLWSLPGLVIPRGRIQVALAGGPNGFAPLTFVNRQVVSNDVETNLQTRFVESSTMHFARQESQMVEKLVSSLNEMRRTQTEIKTVVQPQVEIEHLTRQVYQQLEREIRIEKERRGL